jgi:tRNA 5-methylaminomethyl-2-thiouridine biosynthesis bifunctional protein
MAQTPPKATCHPVPEWQNQPSWRILDCEFGFDSRFFETLRAWQQDDCRPRMLHYVGVCSQWAALETGFHRFSLAQGSVLFTLCVGDVQSQLKELSFAADSIYLDFSRSQALNWTRWRFKALARCCRRGTHLETTALTTEHKQDLQAVGFEMNGSAGAFNPRWQLKAARQPWLKSVSFPSSCVVLGAGLAGASVAASLARRGWQVRVFDTAPKPAAGASGLPVGLTLAQMSADNNHRSRISKAGLQMTRQQAQAFLRQGQDWMPCGVMDVVNNQWQEQAAWIKPERLVQAWMATAGIAFEGNREISDLQFDKSGWQLLDSVGHTLAQTDLLVLASANGTPSLLERLAKRMPACSDAVRPLCALQGIRGQLSWSWQDATQSSQLPKHPVHGEGSLIPSVPQGQQHAWYLGASYEATDAPPLKPLEINKLNRDRLKSLLPSHPKLLDSAFESGAVQAWQGVRCVSQDRLPRVGAVSPKVLPGLWVSTAMGSRGLTSSFLCAELLAAQLMGEPWPVEAKLGKALSPYSNEA